MKNFDGPGAPSSIGARSERSVALKGVFEAQVDEGELLMPINKKGELLRVPFYSGVDILSNVN